MRLFTALDLPPEILAQLERLVSGLRPDALINWSPLNNLHITTKFIGEWPEERLDQLHQVLSTVPACGPIPIGLHDLGWSPNARSPKVLWAGVQGGDSLRRLSSDTDECLASLGILREKRPYTPHVTLARIKKAVPLDRLRARVAELQPAPIGSFVANGFYLFQSEAGSNASVYRKVREYGFGSSSGASLTM